MNTDNHANLNIGGDSAPGDSDSTFASAWLGDGPWLKRDAAGLHIITPPGPQDERGNTVHLISPEWARAMAHFLELFASPAGEA